MSFLISYMNIISLSIDELLMEKADALSDRAKARDLYDIWILVGHGPSKSVHAALLERIMEMPKVIDYTELQYTVYGPLPTVEEMRNDIVRRLDEVRG